MGQLSTSATVKGGFALPNWRVPSFLRMQRHLVLGLRELQAGFLGRAKAHLFDDAVALVAERPATAATWRHDQIKIVAARVFAEANGEIVLGGDLGLFGSKLRGGFELPTSGGNGALGWVILTPIEGQSKGRSGGVRRG